MANFHRLFLVAAVLLTAPLVHAQLSDIDKELTELSYVPEQGRPAKTIKLATEIRAISAGKSKVRLADALANLVTVSDQGAEARQAVADTLSQALQEKPLSAKNNQPPMPYMDLAKLVRYAGVKTTLTDPLLAQADQILANDEADIAKADFTLKGLDGKKYTLSQLKGKIVLVNFWDPGAQCPRRKCSTSIFSIRTFNPRGWWCFQ